ncbi:MAG: Mg-chelatase subunit ChlD [Myxococcota bacterium]|jgi:Mg-chelatase subunit ChlD
MISGVTFEIQLDQIPEGWEAARQFHRLKKRLPRAIRELVEERAIVTIMARAQEMLRHARQPTRLVEVQLPSPGELNLEATLEKPRPWQAHDIVIEQRQPREVEVIAILDMSLSMTGEKIALTALAAAILRLRLGRLAVVCFDTRAHRLVAVGEDISVRELIRRILRVPAQGYTNIEAGLLMSLTELRRSRLTERVGVIMTDGVANVGMSPVPVAARFPRMHVVQVGLEERNGTRTCVAMARAGRGRCYRAQTYEELPGVVRRLVRECFR